MTLLNIFLDNSLSNSDIAFFSLFTGLVGVIGYSLLSSVLNRSIYNSVETFSPVPDSPRTFSFTHGQLGEIQDLFDPIIQTEPKFKEIGVQTLFSDTNHGLQTMINTDLRVSAELSEIGTKDVQASSIINELSDSSVQTLVQYAEKGVQIKPNMNIDLSSAMLDQVETLSPILPPIVDLELTASSTPIPGLVMDVATAVANYYPMFMG
jgi:hypothetical protein